MLKRIPRISWKLCFSATHDFSVKILMPSLLSRSNTGGHRLNQMFFKSIFDPWRIIAQMLLLQCLFYLTMGVWIIVFNILFNVPIHCALMLSPKALAVSGWSGFIIHVLTALPLYVTLAHFVTTIVQSLLESNSDTCAGFHTFIFVMSAFPQPFLLPPRRAALQTLSRLRSHHVRLPRRQHLPLRGLDLASPALLGAQRLLHALRGAGRGVGLSPLRDGGYSRGVPH